MNPKPTRPLPLWAWDAAGRIAERVDELLSQAHLAEKANGPGAADEFLREHLAFEINEAYLGRARA